MHLSSLALVVDDYDKAITYYTKTLGFELREDTPLSETKRWVRVAPSPHCQTDLLLAKAATPEQEAAIGDQTGGRVFLFMHVENFDEVYERYRANGVNFTEEPRNEPFGKVVVFRDLYGNKWDLIEKR